MKYYTSLPARYNNKNCAFTLLELVLIIAIIGILALVVSPRFFTVSVFSNNIFFSEVLSTIRYAQKLSVVFGCDVQVGYASNSVTVNTRQNCKTGDFNQNIQNPWDGNSSLDIQAPDGVNISNSNGNIYFDSLGRAKLISNDNITDTTVTVGSRTLNIVGQTGFVYES